MNSSNSFKKAIALLCLMFVLTAVRADARWIRVGILATKNATISGAGLSVQPSGGSKTSMPSKIVASAKGNSVVIGGKSYKSPVIVSAKGNITCGQYAYEGELVLRAVNGDISVVNRLDIEKYLRGVLGYEVNPTWHIEALKAQAVISRTYALAQMGRHNAQGYDVCPKDHCQVYRGTSVHHASTDRAIAQTRGKVLTWRGELAQTYFCSDSGGATADVKDVWGKPIPYLIVRKEPYPSDSAKSTWQVTLTASEIANALAKKGKGVGKLRSMSIAKRDSAGRATVLSFTGSGGTSTLTSAQFRMLVGARNVRSTFFEFSPGARHDNAVSPAPLRKSSPKKKKAEKPFRKKKFDYSTEPLTEEENDQLNTLIAQKRYTVDERVDMLSHPERKRYYLEKIIGASGAPAGSGKSPATEAEAADEPPVRATRAATEENVREAAPRKAKGSSTADLTGGKVTLYGTGWGHGVGLSQYGAKAMSEHGWSYEKILEYYYPGTKISVRDK